MAAMEEDGPDPGGFDLEVGADCDEIWMPAVAVAHTYKPAYSRDAERKRRAVLL